MINFIFMIIIAGLILSNLIVDCNPNWTNLKMQQSNYHTLVF
jgi:hypothetical protein